MYCNQGFFIFEKRFSGVYCYCFTQILSRLFGDFTVLLEGLWNLIIIKQLGYTKIESPALWLKS